MKIALLQFDPLLSAFESNILKADSLLSQSSIQPGSISLLVLPELAFAGYNHTLTSIQPFLEHISSSPSQEWAARTASRLKCMVSIGFAETTHLPLPSDETATEQSVRPKHANYNSSITIGPDGEVLAHYRKTHLYFTDARWGSYSNRGFQSFDLPLPLSPSPSHPPPSHSSFELPSAQPASSQLPSRKTIKTSFGICMDLNPLNFTAPYTAYELATHVVSSNSALLVLSNAWSTLDDSTTYVSEEMRLEPDFETLRYWIGRLAPLAAARASSGGDGDSLASDDQGEGQGQVAGNGKGQREGNKVVVAICNRCGTDPGGITFGYPPPDDDGMSTERGEGQTRYTGTSCVLEFNSGRVRVRGIMGRGEEGVLVVDCDDL